MFVVCSKTVFLAVFCSNKIHKREKGTVKPCEWLIKDLFQRQTELSSQLMYLQAVENHYLFWLPGPDCFIRLGVTIPDESAQLLSQLEMSSWVGLGVAMTSGPLHLTHLHIPSLLLCVSC